MSISLAGTWPRAAQTRTFDSLATACAMR